MYKIDYFSDDVTEILLRKFQYDCEYAKRYEEEKKEVMGEVEDVGMSKKGAELILQ